MRQSVAWELALRNIRSAEVRSTVDWPPATCKDIRHVSLPAQKQQWIYLRM
jgi:hypothetical protein